MKGKTVLALAVLLCLVSTVHAWSEDFEGDPESFFSPSGIWLKAEPHSYDNVTLTSDLSFTGSQSLMIQANYTTDTGVKAYPFFFDVNYKLFSVWILPLTFGLNSNLVISFVWVKWNDTGQTSNLGIIFYYGDEYRGICENITHYDENGTLIGGQLVFKAGSLPPVGKWSRLQLNLSKYEYIDQFCNDSHYENVVLHDFSISVSCKSETDLRIDYLTILDDPPLKRQHSGTNNKLKLQ